MKTEIILDKTLPPSMQILRNTFTGAVGLLEPRDACNAPERSSMTVLHPGTEPYMRTGQILPHDSPSRKEGWVLVINPITIRFTP